MTPMRTRLIAVLKADRPMLSDRAARVLVDKQLEELRVPDEAMIEAIDADFPPNGPVSEHVQSFTAMIDAVREGK